MGCDIHGYIDYLTKGHNDEMVARNFAKVDINRNYLLFSVIAGVRNYDNLTPISNPKGLPEILSYRVRDDNTIYISEASTDDDEYCTPEQAARWVAQGISQYCQNEHFITHPDWHSHSWLNLEEMRQLREKYLQVDREYEWAKDFPVSMEGVIGAMEALEKLGKEPRFIFWFDN